MVSQDRQRIIEANRSLRLIKNELESLLEKGIIDDAVFDSIHAQLPAESSLSGASGTATPASSAARVASPAQQQHQQHPSSPAAPTASFSSLNLNANPSAAAAPPSYAQTTGSTLHSNNNAQAGHSPAPSPAPNAAGHGHGGPPPPPPSGKPILCHARALYKYTASDARDLSLEKGDRVAVHEYMNADWWMGRNLRSNQEGIFPKNYVDPEAAERSGYPDEKAAYGQQQHQQQQPQYHQGGGHYGQPQQGGYPQPPPQGNPYNANVPPMAVAEGSGQDGGGKTQEYGKKFGKKLGNAAIFGAGATLGGNLVNSIF